MAGLLSAVEFALAIAPFELADQLPCNPLLLDALGARQRGLGEVLNLIDAMEFGWWEEVRGRAALLKASPGVVSDGWNAAWRTACEELGIGRGEG
jgi:c-di-GMP-related signal transduction protein